jgi:hypothetical protein
MNTKQVIAFVPIARVEMRQNHGGTFSISNAQMVFFASFESQEAHNIIFR